MCINNELTLCLVINSDLKWIRTLLLSWYSKFVVIIRFPDTKEDVLGLFLCPVYIFKYLCDTDKQN